MLARAVGYQLEVSRGGLCVGGVRAPYAAAFFGRAVWEARCKEGVRDEGRRARDVRDRGRLGQGLRK